MSKEEKATVPTPKPSRPADTSEKRPAPTGPVETR